MRSKTSNGMNSSSGRIKFLTYYNLWIDGAPLMLTNREKKLDEFELGEEIEEKNGYELELLGQKEGDIVRVGL